MMGLPWYVIVYGIALASTAALILYFLGWLSWIAAVAVISFLAGILKMGLNRVFGRPLDEE